MLHAHGGAVQPNADSRARIIQPAVMGAGRDNVLHAVARNTAGNQGAHQHARDGSVSIGKMKDVRLFFLVSRVGVTAQIHSAESGISDAIVVARLVTIERGDGIDAHCEQVMRAGLKKRKDVLADFDYLGKEVGVTDLGQPGTLLCGGKTGKIIYFFPVEADDAVPGFVRQRVFARNFRRYILPSRRRSDPA